MGEVCVNGLLTGDGLIYYLYHAKNQETDKMDNFLSFKDLVRKNRSYRRFNESERINPERVAAWIELTRYVPSGRNMQPLKYAIITEKAFTEQVFELLAWAGYLKDWPGPVPGERPAAYVAVMKDITLADNIFCDDGIAVQTLLLGAVSDGFGGCIIGSFNKEKMRSLLKIPEHLQLLWIVALGRPVETVILEELQGDDIRYWRDAEGNHHVPKRRLEDLIVLKK